MGNTIDELDTEFDHLRNRLDTLEEKAKDEKAPWYKSPSAAIAVVASIVSVGSTVIGYFHTEKQDLQARRAELRGILQRLVALPKEQVESSVTYKSEQQVQQALSGYLNQENLMLAQQADEIVKRLPSDQVSAIDYMTIGGALQNSRHFPAALKDLKKAAEQASGLDDAVGALRTLGSLQMSMGDQAGAETTFRKAVDIFTVYRDFDKVTQGWTTVQTELVWAYADILVQNFDGASQRISDAESFATKMPNGPVANYWQGQVTQYRQTLASFVAMPSTAPKTVSSPLAPTAGAEPSSVIGTMTR